MSANQVDDITALLRKMAVVTATVDGGMIEYTIRYWRANTTADAIARELSHGMTKQAADEIDRLRLELSRSAIKKTLDHLLAENRVLNAAIDAQAIELAHCNCNRKRDQET
jgi:uncharacterized membrane protein affecting hemolysin expression